MNTEILSAMRAAPFAALLALAGCGGATAPVEESHGEAAAADYERGPHRGRLLRDGDFAVEVTIFEDGVDPEYRVYPFLDDKPLDPAKVDLTIELGRLGGQKDPFAFVPQADFLRGDGVVAEPHSFDVSVRATHDGKAHAWDYESYEGRTSFSREQADAAGVAVEKTGPATIEETVTLAGRVELQPQGRAEVAAWFPGRIVDMTKKIGERVEKDEVLAKVTASSSLQTYTIPAPIAGVVFERRANVGDVADEGPLYVIADATQIRAEFYVYPRDAERLAAGQKVTIRSLDGGASAEAAIEAVLHSADMMTQTIVAHVELPNDDLSWRPGQAVEGVVVVGKSDVPLAVKTEALQRFRDFTVVYARVGETYEVRMLELGRQTPEWTEVMSGVDPGVDYVTKNAFLIRQDVEKSGASHDH
ncbi:MAG: efflux RND transporter periplasmic adaptor subunit [Parvularculaceae bacterium]|nr:efflux RND transporter periplasmic adaptor subunit [Parvularculaceae bacterium]